MVKKTATNLYFYAVGRRKSAVATVKLFKGKEESTVNKVNFDKYFPGESEKVTVQKPFLVTNNSEKFYFQSKVVGGGKQGQIEALVLAIARALKKMDESLTSVLRTNDLLTVDSRVRERRMVGTGGKARRQKQSPKR